MGSPLYRIEFLPDAKKDLAAIRSRKVLEQIDRRILALANDPRPAGCKALQGRWKGLTRVRSGDFRIVYQIIDDRLIVVVVRVGDRKEVYED